ncbi:unnamed protein product [Rotaria sp. Silwood1]|nr:unnamed protein product [Rotaria sp. Silwood1]CAF3395950.1 unnamed protein product [Rotaria sp. Silwood1]CAF3399654.1 unnamed protein product [Rotaria sp. Silwood1]CAF4624775.1 unnamed protein product [Rotaria sp. Silwood1]CAF4770089.1 unnamed protein product [Rotaria sp. Silwood1]
MSTNETPTLGEVTTSAVGYPLVVNIPVNNSMVAKAFELLTNRRVSRSTEQFLVSTETVEHEDMPEYIPLLLEQYNQADEEVKGYIKRLKFNTEGQQFAKAIIIGTKNQFSVSVIATSRRKTGTSDVHKILIATTKKTVEMSASWNFLARWIGIKSTEQKELEGIVSKLNNEDNKKCLEAMALYTLGDQIKTFLGDHVEVRFKIENEIVVPNAEVRATVT